MNISFWGAAGTVTGSCFIVEAVGKKIMVDCGLFQGSKKIKSLNYGDFTFNPGEIDHVVLTHAHIDHSGLLPKLCRLGYRGPITATKATVELCRVLLPDSGHIQETEVERKNRKGCRAGKELIFPVYTVQEAINSLTQFRGFGYEEDIVLAPGIRIRFRDAGHILGSAMVEMWISENGQEEKIIFSGDVGNYNQPLIHDPTQLESADYLVIESTYGNRVHDRTEDRLVALRKVIEDTYRKGGNLIIPAFAVERTQDLLYDLNLLQTSGQMPPMDIYIDSPLAVAVTEIFDRNSHLFDQETQDLIHKGDHPLSMPRLKFSRTTEESQALNSIRSRTIIISASGMCDAGRIKHHLKHNLWRPESTVLFVGYQAEGSLGRRILDGESRVVIHGEQIAVKAEIRRIEGFSAHADSEQLLGWVKGFHQPPAKVFVVHGEAEASQTLAKALTDQLGLNTIIPSLGSKHDLSRLDLGSDRPLVGAPEQLAAVPVAGDLEEAYANLMSEIRTMIDQGIAEGDQASVLDRLKKLKSNLT